MAVDFSTYVPDLFSGSTRLAQEASTLRAVRTAGVDAVTDAQGAVGGDLLATALGQFSQTLGQRAGAMAEAVDGGGATLRSNASQYSGDDASAATSIDGVDFDGGGVPGHGDVFGPPVPGGPWLPAGAPAAGAPSGPPSVDLSRLDVFGPPSPAPGPPGGAR